MRMTHFYHNHLVKKFGSQIFLKDIIAQLEDDVAQNGEVICSIELNGVKLDEDGEEEFGITPVEQIENLKVFLESPDILVRDLVDNWIIQLPELRKMCESISEKMRFEDMSSNLPDFLSFIEVCQYLVQSFDQVEGYISFRCEKSFPEEWISYKEEFANVVREVLASFEKKDYVLLSDLIEYDLGNTLENWEKVFQTIRQDFLETSNSQNGEQEKDQNSVGGEESSQV